MENNGNLLIAESNLDEVSELSGKSKRFLKFKTRRSAAKPIQVAADGSTASRNEMGKRIPRLNDDLQKSIRLGDRQSTDACIMTIKDIGGSKEADLFENKDVQQDGFCMLQGGKLEKEEPMTLTGVTLQYGVHTEVVDDAATAAAVDFGVIPMALRNGIFKFDVNKEVIVAPISMEVFAQNQLVVKEDSANGIGYAYQIGDSRKPLGFYNLHNPKLIPSQHLLNAKIEWGAPVPQYATVRCFLHGSRIYKR